MPRYHTNTPRKSQFLPCYGAVNEGMQAERLVVAPTSPVWEEISAREAAVDRAAVEEAAGMVELTLADPADLLRMKAFLSAVGQAALDVIYERLVAEQAPSF